VAASTIGGMGDVFIGSDAVARGRLTRHELQRWYRPMYPNVHTRRGEPLSVRDRTVGAWLWSDRQGIVSGVAASALHGASWVDADVAIELISNRTRPPTGIITRNETLADDEITKVAGPRHNTRAPHSTSDDIWNVEKRSPG
jgi:hypothetical protein